MLFPTIFSRLVFLAPVIRTPIFLVFGMFFPLPCNERLVVFFVILAVGMSLIGGEHDLHAHSEANFRYVILMLMDTYLNGRLDFYRPLLCPKTDVKLAGVAVVVRQGDEDPLAVFLGREVDAMIVVTVLPILFVYPFIQKYFVKGVMVGSLKG